MFLVASRLHHISSVGSASGQFAMLVLRRLASEKTAIHVLQFEVGIFNGFSCVGLYGGAVAGKDAQTWSSRPNALRSA